MRGKGQYVYSIATVSTVFVVVVVCFGNCFYFIRHMSVSNRCVRAQRVGKGDALNVASAQCMDLTPIASV